MCPCACHSSPEVKGRPGTYEWVHRCGCTLPTLTAQQRAEQLEADTAYWRNQAETFDTQLRELLTPRRSDAAAA